MAKLRPAELPEFANPPLNELVVGVQINPIRSYSLIRAGEVWAIFKDRYPQVQEQAPIFPQFETFGGFTKSRSVEVEQLVRFPHPRFWFLSRDAHELLQFQQDKLLHNWRQVEGVGGLYPRFEPIFDKFATELDQLISYLDRLGPEKVAVNQAEISYVNRIYGEGGEVPRADEWFKFLNFGGLDEPEDVAGSFRRIVRNSAGEPVGRFYFEIASNVDSRGLPMIVVSLTVRGAPVSGSNAAALDFIQQGREIIVAAFGNIVTERANSVWQRLG